MDGCGSCIDRRAGGSGAGGAVRPPLQSGEIYVRGPQVSGEYEGRSVLDGAGWFPTRDAGYVDEEGYLFLSGRADDVIVRGGENISPGEIEDLLHQHTAVSDVALRPGLCWRCPSRLGGALPGGRDGSAC